MNCILSQREEREKRLFHVNNHISEAKREKIKSVERTTVEVREETVGKIKNGESNTASGT